MWLIVIVCIAIIGLTLIPPPKDKPGDDNG
jgi:hypothetical protein